MHIATSSLAKTMELKWIKTRPKTLNPRDKPGSLSPSPLSLPIYISTKPSHVDAAELRRLYGACNLSGHRFPSPSDSDSVDDRKLRIALTHSSFVVSVFAKPRGGRDGDGDASTAIGVEGFLQSVVEPVGPYNGELVGFGRAVSDMGLTASIYDVMVEPSLRGMGIGRLIVQRITRMLISREIYDIAALCSEDERPFFEACGFRDDILGSTTMMYTRTVSADSEAKNQMAKSAGRKLLLIPPIKTPLRLPSP